MSNHTSDRKMNLSDLFANTQMLAGEGFETFSWSPGKVEEHLPCTEVHVLVRKPKYGNMVFVLRLKSRQVCQDFIDALTLHMNDVWPTEEEKPNAKS